MFRLFLLVWDIVTSIGSMPDVENETEFRAFCAKLAAALQQVAALTGNDVDDKAATVLVAVIAEDKYWGMFYAVLVAALDFAKDDEGNVVGAEPNVATLAQDTELDPGTWVMIISTVIKIIEMWRNRKRG